MSTYATYIGDGEVLDQVCTLHQMYEVSYYYYSQMRPLLTEITNARTATASQAAAEHVVEQVLELMDPLFVSMVKAVPWKATLQKPRRP
ncbi:Uncharacterized protein SCF082_LOCUS52759 [Durusdinium trenchii]|uniref:Uncharacterized protein n=1 Tax=Durusdinium trenchii TaxID=1381693 RepID=A0ABP0SNL4_9DINO